MDVDEISSTTAILGQATSPPWPSLPVATSLEPIRVTSMTSSPTLCIFLDIPLVETLQVRPYAAADPWTIVRIKHAMLQHDVVGQSAWCANLVGGCCGRHACHVCVPRTIGSQVPKLSKKIAQVRERLDTSLVASLDAPTEKVLQFLNQEESKLDEHRERATKLLEYQVSFSRSGLGGLFPWP